MTVFELVGRLTIDGIDKANTQLSSMEDKFRSTGTAMTNAGKKMSLYVTAPLAIMGGMVIKTAAAYSESMAKVKAVTGATTEQFAQMDAQAKELGRTTRYTASEVAEAMAFMGMAGMDTNKIMAALPDTLNLAAAGGLAMGQAADIITNIMAGFGMATTDLTGAVDVLTKAFTSSNVDLGMLGDSMKYAGPIAKSFGMSFEETTAIMGSFGNAGIQGSMAGTSLRQALIQLNAKSEEFGITMYDTSGKILPMVNILEQLEQKGMTAGEMVELFGARAGPAMAALLQTGSESLRDFTTELEGAAGTAENIAKTQMEGLHGILIILKSAFEGLQLAIADELVPILTPLIEKITNAFRWFSNLPGPVRKTAVVISLVAAAMGPLLMSMGFAATGLATLIGLYRSATTAMLAHKAATIATTTATNAATASTVGFNIAMKANPIGLVIGLIALLVTGIIALHNNWDKVVDFMDRSLTKNQRKFNEWSRSIRADADTMLAEVESAYEQFVSNAQTSAEQQITAAEDVRDAEKRAIEERLGFYQDFTRDKIAEIDKQMLAELAAIDGPLGEQAQAYLDMLDEQESDDEKREAKIEARRIRDLKHELEYGEDLTKSRKLRIQDEIADYEAKLDKEKAGDRLFNAIKESDYEAYFESKKSEADAAFNTENALILNQQALQVASYQAQRDAFVEMHEVVMAGHGDILKFAEDYNALIAMAGGKKIEIPELPALAGTAPAGKVNRPTNLDIMGNGGMITEPTLLYGLKSQRPYAIAGEAGDERVSPVGDSPAGALTQVTNNFSIAQLVVREEADVDKVAQKLYQMQALRTRYA